MSEGKWITLKDGRRILLKPKSIEMKDTNFYMNDAIRKKTNKKDLTNDIKQKTIDYMKNNYRAFENVEFIDTSLMDKMKEFDRLERPTTSNLDELAEDIINNGFKEPLILDFNPYNGQLKIAEGNHRLAVAKKLNLKQVPVIAMRSKYMEDGTYTINPKNIVPREDGVLGTYYDDEMKPSKLGKLFGGEDYIKGKTKGVTYVE